MHTQVAFTTLQPNTTIYATSCRAPSQSTLYPNCLIISAPISLMLHNQYSNYFWGCYTAFIHQPQHFFFSCPTLRTGPQMFSLLSVYCLTCCSVMKVALARRCSYTISCYEHFSTISQATVVTSPC